MQLPFVELPGSTYGAMCLAVCCCRSWLGGSVWLCWWAVLLRMELCIYLRSYIPCTIPLSGLPSTKTNRWVDMQSPLMVV